MKKIIRYWNQNRKKIIITIAIIAFAIIIIQIINEILKTDHSDLETNTIIDKTKPIQSVITGEKVSEEKTDANVTIIKEFVQYCNQKQYEKAYGLLTEACQKEFQNDINIFVSNYHQNVFTKNRTYDLELWMNVANRYTYKIKFYEDNLLATGQANLNKNIEDYITIIEENGERKLNINGFIDEREIGKSEKVNDIEFIINRKRIYKNYETYDITIRNRSLQTILISENHNNENIYLLDKNDVKYVSFLNEIPFSNLSLKSGYEKNISIRFNKMYDVYRTVKKLEFQNVILNQEKYQQNPNENAEKAIVSIEI